MWTEQLKADASIFIWVIRNLWKIRLKITLQAGNNNCLIDIKPVFVCYPYNYTLTYLLFFPKFPVECRRTACTRRVIINYVFIKFRFVAAQIRNYNRYILQGVWNRIILRFT